jgi:branched-chain amino acid transport system permease protein
MIIQLLVNGIIVGCSYALIAFGFALIYNTTRTFHFAHGAVYTCSVYFFYTLSMLWRWPFWLVIILTLVLTALLGITIDEVVYRPLGKRNSSLLIRMLSSLGVYIIIINLIIMIFGNEIKVLNAELQPTVSFSTVILSKVQVITAVSCFLIFTALLLFLRMTMLGKMVRAMRDDPDLISTMGVNPQNVRRFVFGLGSSLAGVAAILKGLDVGTDPNAGMVAFLNGAVAVIIGGVGIFEGVILGALLVGILQNFAIWKFSAQWQDTVTFLVLILFLLIRPEGFFGRRRRIEEIEA